MKLIILILFLLIIFFNILNIKIKETFINTMIIRNDSKYLLNKPEAGSIMDMFPEPPFHLLVTTPIGIVLFYLIYSPLLIKDLLAKRAA